MTRSPVYIKAKTRWSRRCMFISLQKQYNSIIEMDIFANFSHHHSNFRVKYNIHLYNGNFRTQKSGFNCYTTRGGNYRMPGVINQMWIV